MCVLVPGGTVPPATRMGGRGFCTGRGTSVTSGIVKIEPRYENASCVHIPTMISSISSMRRPRVVFGT